MDERDIKILSAIANLGTGSPDRLHEETGIPKSTIYYRLNNLREQGVIENDLYDIDHEKVGLSVTVIAEVTAEYGEDYHDRVGEKLAEVEGVDQVYFTMGDTDFVVIGRLGGQEMVEGLIGDFESIEEVIRTRSMFVISTIKNEPRLLKNFHPDTLRAIADDSAEET
jgi:DNA-binding Lrp family transcriptional regulator